MEIWLCCCFVAEAFAVGIIIGYFGFADLGKKIKSFCNEVKMFLAKKWLVDCGYTVHFYKD